MKRLLAIWFAAMLSVAAVFGVCEYLKTPKVANPQITSRITSPAFMLEAPAFRADSYFGASWQVGFSGLLGAVSCASCHAERIYRVRKGDQLGKIAQANSLKGWGSLYHRNRKTIGGNPNLIKPGQLLLIPLQSSSTPSRASVGKDKLQTTKSFKSCGACHAETARITGKVDCSFCHQSQHVTSVATAQAKRLVATRRAARSPSDIFYYKHPGANPLGERADLIKAIELLDAPGLVKERWVAQIKEGVKTETGEFHWGERRRQMVSGGYRVDNNVVGAWKHQNMFFKTERWPAIEHEGERWIMERVRACFNLTDFTEVIPLIPAPPPATEKPLPPLVHIVAIPDNILKGTCTTLFYKTHNADNAVIDQGVGWVEAGEGNREVCPTDNKVYSIVAYGSGGQATDNTSVSVYEPLLPEAKVGPRTVPDRCRLKPTWEGNIFSGAVVNAEGASSLVHYWGANAVLFPEECYSEGTIWRTGPSAEVVGWRGHESRDGRVDFHGQRYVLGGEIQHFGQWFKDIYDVRFGRKEGWTSTPDGYRASERTGIMNLGYSHTRWYPRGSGWLKSWRFAIQGDLDLENGVKSSNFKGSTISSSRDPRLNASEIAAHLSLEMAREGKWNPFFQLDGAHAFGPNQAKLGPGFGISYKNGLAEVRFEYDIVSGSNNNTVLLGGNLSLDKTYDLLKMKLRKMNQVKPPALTTPAKLVE